jgi:iron complex outermembrane receptor protein
MQTNLKNTLTPMAAAVAAALSTSAPVLAQQEGAVLEEIIVTARKRTESLQEIPVSIQALSGDDIKAMGAKGLEDYTRFVPSVNVVSYGNGSSTVVFRGANVDGGGYVGQSTASVYLDEISVTTTGSQPSIRMVDIHSVEALSGPQGTLYGSDAQAGTLRIITNKPDVNNFEMVLDGSFRGGDDSDDSYEGSIVLNLPIIQDKLALRVVGFTAEDGGFIDNVYGHTPDTSNVEGLVMPSGFGTLDNADVVEDDWNDSQLDGWRAALRWEVNEEWAATASYIHQETKNGASNSYDPYAGDYKTVNFNSTSRDDDYDMYSLVIEGDLGFAQLVSATSYFERDIDNVFDNTVYVHYYAAIYCHTYDLDPAVYYWYYSPPEGGGVLFYGPYCQGTTAEGDYLTVSDTPYTMDRFTQEFRLSAQGDTIDWLVGLYYEDSSDAWKTDFSSPTSNTYGESVSAGWSEWYFGTEPGTYDDATTWWYSSNKNNWEQYAAFGELTWHINDKMDLTLGARYFDRDNDFTYQVEHPDGFNNEKTSGDGNDTEFVPKVALSYSLADDVMVYALWTEGYRAGGTNRSRGEPFFPTAYESDKMTNYEAGIKSTLADGSVRANATVYYMDWEDYQMELTDPSQQNCPDDGPTSIPKVCGQPWQTVLANAGDAHILGVQVELDWAVSANFLVGMNAEYREAETDSTLDMNGDGEPNVVKNSDLPISPEWTGAAWAEYSWPVDYVSGNGFARLQWSYTDESVSLLRNSPADGSTGNPQLKNNSYNIGDFSIGLQADTWEVSLFVNNITEEIAQYQHEQGTFLWGQGSAQDGRDHVSNVYTNRPREFGFRFTKRWGG